MNNLDNFMFNVFVTALVLAIIFATINHIGPAIGFIVLATFISIGGVAGAYRKP